MVLKTPTLMRSARASESRTAQVSLERRKLRVVEDIGMLLSWLEDRESDRARRWMAAAKF
jgi:hypothetical protein